MDLAETEQVKDCFIMLAQDKGRQIDPVLWAK